MHVQLLGGLEIDGRLERSAGFHQLSGKLEQALVELDRDQDRIGFVTEVLSLALDNIGGKPVEREMIDSLCMADRQYLMLKLATLLFGDNVWLEVSCKFCQESFDINIDRSELPFESAGETFPYLRIKLDNRNIHARVPSGTDQKAIQGLSEEQAINLLLERCIHFEPQEGNRKKFISSLDEKDYDAIDSAFDAVSPSLCEQLVVTCPECKKKQFVKLDHYDMGQMNDRNFYDEVHIIASHYHWSEEDILSLARDKRKRYVSMINRASGIFE